MKYKTEKKVQCSTSIASFYWRARSYLH